MSDLELKEYVQPRRDRYEYGQLVLVINVGENGQGAPIGFLPANVGLEVGQLATSADIWPIINELGADGWYISSVNSFEVFGGYVCLQYTLMRVYND